MATITLTVNQGDIRRSIDSLITEFGPKLILDPGPPVVEESDLVYFKRVIGVSINRVIKGAEARSARDTALAAHTDVVFT